MANPELLQAIEDFLKGGAHEGPCTNVQPDGTKAGPCWEHWHTAMERKERLEQALAAARADTTPQLTRAELVTLGQAIRNLEIELDSHTLPLLDGYQLVQSAADLRDRFAAVSDAFSPVVEGGDEALWRELGLKLPDCPECDGAGVIIAGPDDAEIMCLGCMGSGLVSSGANGQEGEVQR